MDPQAAIATRAVLKCWRTALDRDAPTLVNTRSNHPDRFSPSLRKIRGDRHEVAPWLTRGKTSPVRQSLNDGTLNLLCIGGMLSGEIPSDVTQFLVQLPRVTSPFPFQSSKLTEMDPAVPWRSHISLF